MNRRSDRLPRAAAAAACAVLLLLSQTTGRSAEVQLISGNVPKAISHMRPVRHFDGTNRLDLAIGLPLRDPVGLSAFLHDIYDPNSPNFHQFLTPAQFTAKFGPTEADYEAVKAFATANGLRITHTHPNRVLLDVEGSVSDIEKAMHISLQEFNHPYEKRTFFAPDTNPTVDCGAAILHVAGLDNFTLPHANYKAHPISKTHGAAKAQPADATTSAPRPQSGSGPDGLYLGDDFRAAYVPSVTLDGSGQKVALLEFDAYFDNDPVQYESDAGIANIHLSNIPIDGFNGPPGAGNGEVALDIEMVMAMAPGVSQIFVYEATNSPLVPATLSDDMLNAMANDDLANQLSSSWTFPVDGSTEQIFKQMAAQGQSYFNASGDSGAYPPGEIPTPNDSTNITLVGGTTLFTTGPSGSWQSEVVWSYYNAGTGSNASSGGFDSTFPIPSWQKGINMSKNQGSTTFRNLPDVALTADNIFIVADNGQSEDVSGTSAAAPLWAGFTALVNQQGMGPAGRGPVGFLNPALYSIGKGSSYSDAFHDITSGNNTNLVTSNAFFATQGFDLCTGWGTPTGVAMINLLAPIPTGPILAVLTNAISGGNGNGIIDFDECNNFSVTLTNEGVAAATAIQAFLTTTTPGVIISQPNSAYPPMPVHTAALDIAPFTISTEGIFVCGTPIHLTLTVKSAQGIFSNTIVLPSGSLGPPQSFANTTALAVPPGKTTGVGSPVVVSGLQALGHVTVSADITASEDVGIVLKLTAPNGVSVVLTENNGGSGANYGISCSSFGETVFDDDAAVPIADGGAPYLGSFQPQEPLALFNLYNGASLNGVWTLNVINSIPGNIAQLNCWNLTITPEVCTDGGGPCPGADLSLTMNAIPNAALVGGSLVYNLTVSNAGPSTADNISITQTLPEGDVFLTTSNYPNASASQSGQTLNLTLGSLPVYGSATIAVVTTPTVPGIATSVATVSSPTTDPNLDNNTAAATANVSRPGADLGVSINASTPALLEGGLVTYSIGVTNNGPSDASEVTLFTTLPPNVNLISTATTQGTITSDGSIANLGTLPFGSNAVVTLVISPTTTGSLTANSAVTLSAGENDPISANNQASVTVIVGPSADLSVTGFFSPPTVLSAEPYTNISTIVNNGPSQATGVLFTQTIPGGAALISSSAPGATVVNGIINWNISPLTNGASISITNILKAPTLLPGIASQSLATTLTVIGQPGDPKTNNNVVVLQALVEPPTITIVPINAVLLSGSANGAIAPGASVQVELNLQNTGNVNTTNVVATIQTTGGVTLPSPTVVSYGQIAAGAPPVGRQFGFTANGTNGGTVVVTLQLTDGSVNLGAVQFTFYMPVVATFWNPEIIQIPNQSFVPEPDSGPANPYPSLLTVSNVAGFVSGVTVTLSNISHSYPHDIAMLLVGPGGQNVALMAGAGNNAVEGMANDTIILDSTAPNALPASGQIVSGTYRPADYAPSYSLSNAPAAPYSTNLGVFNGISANGVWSLYAYDTSQGDAGVISNGWALTVTTITPVNQEADMSASILASVSQLTLGDSATFLLSVTNNGPNAATAYLTNIIPAGMTFVSSSLPKANYTQTGQVLVYTIGTLAAEHGATITNVYQATDAGLQISTAVAASTLPDPNFVNNSASASVAVSMPFGDVGASVTSSPAPAIVGRDLAYTLVVKNYGPSNALAVTGSFPLAGLSFVSASPSQGSASLVGGAVQCSFGTVPVGDVATLVVTAIPSTVGKLTNVWTVGTSDQDTNQANNATLSVVTVINPAPIIAAGKASLVTQGGNFSNGGINANETVTVALTLNNIGSASTTNLTGTLQGNANLTPVTTSQSYGAIAAGASATQPYTFTAHGAPGSAVNAILALKDGGDSLGNVTFAFLIPVATNYSQTGKIIIPEFGPGQPYPSQLQISGLTGLVTSVTVTLNGFTHTFPHDVNVLLADPAGQELFLMSHVGGAYSVTNLTLTFSDTATGNLPTTQLSSGTYLPTALTPLNPFPGIPAAPETGTLASFNGTTPDGDWSLYVYDDTEGNAGAIATGWSLGLTSVKTVNPASVLSAGMVHAPDPVFVGDYITYLVTITNQGPDAATSVVLTDPFPSAVTYSSSTLSQGTGTIAAGTLTVNFGTVPAGATATATIRVIAEASGAIVNTATVTSPNTDLYLADNTTANESIVLPAPISLLNATNFPGGLQLTLKGQAGQTYGIQVSGDLIHWSTSSTNTSAPNGAFIFTDTGTNLPSRFYRAVRLAQ